MISLLNRSAEAYDAATVAEQQTGVSPSDDALAKRSFLSDRVDDREDFLALLTKVVDVIYDDFILRPTCFTEKTPNELSELFGINQYAGKEGSTEDELVRLLKVIVQDSANLANSKCLAYMSSIPTKISIVADLVASILNQSLDTWDQGPAATTIEQALVKYLGELTKLPITYGYVTPGATISNLHAITLARDAKLHSANLHAYPDKRDDLRRRLRAFVSTETHFSIEKGMHLSGLDANSVVKLPVSSDGRIDIPLVGRAMQQAVGEGNIPFLIVGTAGTTTSGSIDDLSSLATLANEFSCWFHVDAAHGGACLLSDYLRQQLKGIEKANSIAVDSHKFMYQPIGCGLFLTLNTGCETRAAYDAPYLTNSSLLFPEAVDSYHHTIQTTRRFDALKLYLCLSLLGPKFFQAIIESRIYLTECAWNILAKESDFEVPTRPQLNILLFRYKSDLSNDTAIAELNRNIWTRLYRSQKSSLSITTFQDTQFLRMVVMNPQTTEEDLRDVINETRLIGKELLNKWTA